MEQLNIIELFAGIGAPRCALTNIGHNVASTAVELDTLAVTQYNGMYDQNIKITDVSEFKYEGPYVDFLVGGFPCQDLSKAGLERGMTEGSGTRSSLVWQMVRIINEVKPRFVMFENVKALLNKTNKPNFDLLLAKLNEMGYNVSYDVLKASEYGLPQKRERVFIIARKRDNQNYSSLYPVCERPVDFSKLEKKPMTPMSRLLDAHNVNNEDWLMTDAMKDYIVSTDKTGKFQVSKKMIINPSIAPTLTTREGQVRIASSVYISPSFPWDTNVCGVDLKPHAVRKLSTLEMWRLMGFSDDMHQRASKALDDLAKINKKYARSKTKALRCQAGNSISVNVLEELFKHIDWKGQKPHDIVNYYNDSNPDINYNSSTLR